MKRRTSPATVLAALFVACFLLPIMAALSVWSQAGHPTSWRNADWSSSGILAHDKGGDAAVHVLAARTGGYKGALSIHSWILVRKRGEAAYTRYDKVGWGQPVRRNAFAPDGLWYSNRPYLLKSIRGAEAERLIPKIERAIGDYPYDYPGGYRMWPGPNSNSFIAHILRRVPEIGAELPVLAIGRDYPAGGGLAWLNSAGGDLGLALYGIAGIAIGRDRGIELQFLGFVAGFDPVRPSVTLPGFGRIGVSHSDSADR